MMMNINALNHKHIGLSYVLISLTTVFFVGVWTRWMSISFSRPSRIAEVSFVLRCSILYLGEFSKDFLCNFASLRPT
jgi:hypothetical protein